MDRKQKQGSPSTGIHEQQESVITPGGPRPPNQVHRVKHGQAVRRNEDGTYTIVPTQQPKKQ